MNGLLDRRLIKLDTVVVSVTDALEDLPVSSCFLPSDQETTYICVMAFVLGLEDNLAVMCIEFPGLLDQSGPLSLFGPVYSERWCPGELEHSVDSNIHGAKHWSVSDHRVLSVNQDSPFVERRDGHVHSWWRNELYPTPRRFDDTSTALSRHLHQGVYSRLRDCQKLALSRESHRSRL